MNYILAALACISVIVPFVLGHKYGRVPYVSPLHIVAYLAFLGMLLKTIYMASGGELIYEDYNVPESTVIGAYAYITYFVLLICLGYRFAVRGRKQLTGRAIGEICVRQVKSPVTLFVLSIATAGIVVQTILSSRGLGSVEAALYLDTLHALNSSKLVRIEGVEGYGESFAAIKIFLVIPLLALVVFVARAVLWKRRTDVLMAALLLAINVFLVLFKGSRIDLLFTFGAIMVTYLLLGGKISAKVIRNSLVAVAAITFIFVAMTSLRTQKGASEDIALNTDRAIEHIFESTYFLDVNVPIMVLERHGKSDFLLGESYVAWTYAWVPRAFWKEKPVVALGPYVKQQIFGIPGSIGGINPTGPGEAFLNFGWLGIFVGFLLGILYRKLEDFTLSARGITRRFGLWLYPVSIVPFLVGTLQSSFSATLLGTATECLLIVALCVVLRRRFSVVSRVGVSRRTLVEPRSV